MNRTLGTTEAPPATRIRRPGWRDPRLWIGVALVAASVLVGARVMASADDTVAVWAVGADMGAGDTVTEDDLVARDVQLDDAVLARYLTVTAGMPEHPQLVRGVTEGELLPRSALGTAEETSLQRVPVWAPVAAVPPGIGAGSVVDVWAARDGRAATRLLDDAVVIEAPRAEEAFGPSGNRQVILGVPQGAEEQLARTIGAAVRGGLVLTGQG